MRSVLDALSKIVLFLLQIEERFTQLMKLFKKKEKMES